MAFNEGPQPQIVVNQNGIRYVDPNPTDQTVNHEDLVMYVKFVARTKGRSILTVSDEDTTVEIEQKFVRNNTNFTYPDGKDVIGTDWTNLGGGPLDPGEDIGTFGISNINIEFKSSFMPKIVIDFVDVRGATLFEQGPCSPYAAFFHLPYPVFELTVKGYYGKPVTYTLALTKFNTKFNAETGNFESKGEFVGYTYAFLADIPMGYIMASTYMQKGKDIFPAIWAKYRTIDGLDTIDGIPLQPVTLYELIKRAKKLETETPKLKNTFEIIELAKLGKLKNTLTTLRDTIIKIEVEWLKITVGKSKNAGIKTNAEGKKHTLFYNIPNNGANANDNLQINRLYNGKLTPKEDGVIYPFLGDGTQVGFNASKIGSLLTTVKGIYASSGNALTPPKLPLQNIVDSLNGFWDKPPESIGDLSSYNIDIYKALLQEIDQKLTEVDKSFRKTKDNVKTLLNAKVKEILGFNPSVRNVFAIILSNTEVFLEILKDASVRAEDHHTVNIDDILTNLQGASGKVLDLKDTTVGNGAQLNDEQEDKQKIYPWPTYYQTTSVKSGDGDSGDKETYPGENILFTSWPEVQFVESFVKALTELKEDFVLLNGEFDNIPGFDNFVPITVLETPILGVEESSCRWLSVGRGSEQIIDDGEGMTGTDSLYSTIGENAFMVGDYSFINSLTLWKSQLGFVNGWGFETRTGGKGPNINGYENDLGGLNNLIIGPQTLANNPVVIEALSLSTSGASFNNLGRYGGKGMPLKATNATEQIRKIVPTNKETMKNYGYIDGLNCLSTLSMENDSDLLGHLKSQASNTDNSDIVKKLVKEALKKRWGSNYKTETFDEWSVSATEEIGGTKELVTKQNIWNNQFSYVKTNNVLTLKGPIPNSNNDINNKNYFHSNPNENPKNGCTLMTETTLSSFRAIELTDGEIPSQLITQYTEKYGIDVEGSSNDVEAQSAVVTSGSESGENSISYSMLKGRPLYSGEKQKAGETTPTYISTKVVVNNNNALETHKGTLLLYRDRGIEGMFFSNYLDKKELNGSNGEIIYDIGSSTGVYSSGGFANLNGETTWSNFVGPAASTHGFHEGSAGVYDAFIQTPLWTINYPLYKGPYHSLGYKPSVVLNMEIVNVDTDVTKANRVDTEQDAGNSRWYNNWRYNESRNATTWWGLNNWGTGNKDLPSEDWVLPLSYLFIMSLGFDHPVSDKQNLNTGHYYPNDGASFNQPSSTTVFTQHPGIFKLPMCYTLLMGAILWRAKEGHMLKWDGIEPTKEYTGWNRGNSSIGIDDLSDPVWFFHNSISRPWELGGAIPTNNLGRNLANDANLVYSGNWLRDYIGIDEGGFDRWGATGGFKQHQPTEMNTNLQPYIIGPTVGYGSITEPEVNSEPNYYSSLSISASNLVGYSHQGWTKSHQWEDNQPRLGNDEDSQTQSKSLAQNNAINRGMFDQCRQDQIPFLAPQFMSNNQTNREWFDPATLVFTCLQKQDANIKNSGPIRRSYVGQPSVAASTTEGWNTQAPNREGGNEYLTLKEKVKEVMFLPKSLKEKFIKFFVDWSKNEAIGDGLSWLNTIDVLNFSSGNGIGASNISYNDMVYDKNKLIERETPKKTFAYAKCPWADKAGMVRGISGLLGPNYIFKVLNHQEVKQSGWFYGKNQPNNPYFQHYGITENRSILTASFNTQYVAKGTPDYSRKCFKSTDLVEMFNGEMKAIKNVEVGNEVKSMRNNKVVNGIVTKKLVHPINNVVEVIKINGITAEPYHPTYFKGKWVPIKELGSITTEFIGNWYNLEIDGNTNNSEHNYIIGNLIVSGLGDNQKLNTKYQRQPKELLNNILI